MNRFLLPLLLCCAFSLLHVPAYAADDLPEIVKIRGRTVTVKVPAGFDRVALQVLKKRASANPRRAEASGADWKTVRVEYPRGAETLLEFRLARLTPRRHLQVLGYKDDELPGSLLTGITSFLGQPLTGDGAGGTAPPGPVGPEANGAMFASDARSAGETRTVEEADIWKVRGDRLYFFNERRGLQVFDLKNPDEPALLGSLRMPGVGEDMYLLDDAHVVLLKKAWDFFWFDFRLSPVITRGTPILFVGDVASTVVTNSSAMTLAADAVTVRAAEANLLPQQTSRSPREIVVVNVADGEPKIVGRESFEGSVLESRLVGRVLYLATHVYGETDENVALESGAELTSYDLHDVAQPVRRDRIRLGGWANAVAATDRFFFVAKSGASDGTQIDVIDISDAHGAMQKRGAVPVQGYVQDKFKMHLSGDVLTVVSAIWGGANGGRPVTELATFSLSNPDVPARLGELQLAPGETVRATRFDGNRGYVVTFEQIDPLWVVDLSEPTAPKVLGHAEAPGFSTYIEPLGDRLVTIGLVNWRPAVSLFDVADSAKPRLLSQIVFGDREDGQWAYSEAAWNEKAFNVLAEEGLILFPISIHDAKGYRSGVQLVDLRPDKVVKRGTVEDAFNPRRATVHGNRIVAISPTHLTSINAADRDAPKVTAKVEIAWSVDRLFVVGDHLVQLGTDWEGNESRATLTVTPVASPDETLATLDLPALPVVSATRRDQTLYVLLGRSQRYVYLYTAAGGAANDGDEGEAESDATLLTFDLSSLPAIQLTGSVSVTAPELTDSYWYDALPHWIDETTLAFSVGKYGRLWLKPFWYDPPEYVTPASGADLTSSVIRVNPQPYWSLRYLYGRSQVVLAFNVADSKAPKFASSIEIGAEKPWNVAPPVAAGKGRLYASYQLYGKVLREDQWDYRKDNDHTAYRDEALDPETNRHFLQIIDYSNPAQPFLEEAAPNLPGRLESVTRSGRVLFTRGPEYNGETGAPLEGQALHASALDGTAVHLLDQLSVRDDYRDTVRYRNNLVLILQGEPTHIWRPSPPSENDGALRVRLNWWGGSYEENPNKSRLAAWELGEEGKFAKLDELELEHDTSLHFYDELGVTFAQANQPRFLDLSNATDIRVIGSGQFEGISALYDHADGSLQRGLWIPTGHYGVEPIPFFVE